MKRKSGRKAAKKDEENSADIEDTEQNGEANEVEEEAPKDKRRKSSKGGRKSVSFNKKEENDSIKSEEASEDNETEEDVKEELKEEKKGRSKRASRKEPVKETDPLADSEEEQPEENGKKKSRKNKKSKDKKEETAESSEEIDEDDETQYEVEAVLDEKNIKGLKHYLIRWKGYEEESDTWEPEDTLDCKELIEDYKKKKSDKASKPTKKKEKKESKPADWDENDDFEVDRILEVHFKKNGKREFLVSWKGYPASDNSWEPEENMDCKDLIQKFMEKVEQAKQIDEKELRANRKPVQRYTLATQDTGRRLSKRFSGKERVQYHDAE